MMVKTVMSAMVMALVAANDEAALSASPSKNIVELAESVPTLSTLVAAVVACDLAETLSQPGPWTVFAPDNAAFNVLPEGVFNSLMKPANKDLLLDILWFHVLPGQVFTDVLSTHQVLETVGGKLMIVVKSKEQGVQVTPYVGHVGGGRYAKVTAADNEASNGVVHIIDGVLLPPAREYAQCGGKEFKGLLTSCWPLECVKQNNSYSQCLKPTLGAYLASWVKAKEGKIVGSGDSWDLAHLAIDYAKDAGFNITGSQGGGGSELWRWSSQTVNYKKAQPGDILEFVNYTEQTVDSWQTTDNCESGGIPAVCHTAVVVKSFDSASCGIEVEEQNWTNFRANPVYDSVYHPCSKTGGSMTVYRMSASMMDETVVV